MADPRSTVPYYDPYDDPIDFEFLNTQPNPTLASLSPNVFNPQNDQHVPMLQPYDVFNYQSDQPVHMLPPPDVGPSNNMNIVGPSEEPLDPLLWDIFINNFGNSNEAGPSNTAHEDDHGVGGSSMGTQGINLDGAKPLPVWPPPPVPFSCTCCFVLREFIHTDGNYTTKLEIHGRVGLICHSILQCWDHGSVGISNPQHYMFDFCKKSIEDVKQFLQQYCSDRKNAGFTMVPDALSVFYDGLMAGIDSEENIHHEDFADPTPTNSEQPAESEAERMNRSHLARQRERAGRLTLKDFESYFHLPMEEAARRLNLCPTVVKKICRRDGMQRWPYRKIKSLQRQISIHRANLSSQNAQERTNAAAEIARLELEIVGLCTGNRGE